MSKSYQPRTYSYLPSKTDIFKCTDLPREASAYPSQAPGVGMRIYHSLFCCHSETKKYIINTSGQLTSKTSHKRLKRARFYQILKAKMFEL